ncbi:MAG TPA: peptidylprolyl isomerase [Pirellulaceae bacterium]|nr:peptidylprolyl isomerase [Pirellulaceae bacterium]
MCELAWRLIGICGIVGWSYIAWMPWACAMLLQGESLDPDSIVAVVDGTPIVAGRIEHALRQTVGDRVLDDAQQERLRREILQQTIDRHLIMRALSSHQQAAGPTEVQLELDLLREELARVGRTLEDYWQQTGWSEATWRLESAWRISWRRHVDHYWTEERLQDFYDSRRRDFDGTQMRVAQILFARGKSDDELQKAVQDAERVRQSLMAGELAWGNAVELYSIAPSRVDQGDLGWIGRRQPMPDAFTAAAFQLNPGEISPPLASSFGVHLIRCLEVKPGPYLLGDVRDEVRKAAIDARFREWADELRQSADILIQPR